MNFRKKTSKNQEENIMKKPREFKVSLIQEWIDRACSYLSTEEKYKLGYTYYDDRQNGFEFDWNVNDHIPPFTVWYEENQGGTGFGAIRIFINKSGLVQVFVYHDGDAKPFHVIQEKFKPKDISLFAKAVENICLKGIVINEQWVALENEYFEIKWEEKEITILSNEKKFEKIYKIPFDCIGAYLMCYPDRVRELRMSKNGNSVVDYIDQYGKERTVLEERIFYNKATFLELDEKVEILKSSLSIEPNY